MPKKQNPTATAVGRDAGLAGGYPPYTPGPWKATGSSQRGTYFKVRGTLIGLKWTIANCHYDGDSYLADKAEAEANARLIAAAPEMLTALWAAEAALQSCYEINEFPADGKSDCNCALTVIREAIRKAMVEPANKD